MIYCDDTSIEALANELSNQILGVEATFDYNITIEVDPDLDIEAEVYEIDFGEYNINLRDDIENIRVSIAHELVHVKQYLEGRLVMDGDEKYWEGELISNDTPYKELPWEVEAYELEGTF